MKVCVPTERLEGMDSQVFGHFGSAPGFVIVDIDTMQVEELKNGDLHHAHGMCQPLKALGGKKVDGIIVGGIGLGALNKLLAEGVMVYRAVEGTVSQNIQMIKDGRLPQFSPQFTCGGHAGGCGHHGHAH